MVLQQLDVQITFGRPRGPGDVAQSGRGEVEGGLAVGECTDHTGATPYLAQDAFERIVGSDSASSAPPGRLVGQRLLDRRCHKLGSIVKARAAQLIDHLDSLLPCRAMSSPAWIALSIAAISRTLVEGTWLKMLRYQMHDAALPRGLGEELRSALG